MAEIEAEARALFPVQDILAVHRWGSLSVGEPIVFVAAAAAHRRAAFDAAEYLMDQFKTRAPFWNKEEGPAGARWIEARPADRTERRRGGQAGLRTGRYRGSPDHTQKNKQKTR